MIRRVMSADWLKIHGKGLWFLVGLGPLGLVAMQALNFGLRYDYIKQEYAMDLWGALLENISFFVPVALYLGSTLICSLMANIEHQTSSWKQLLALPISRVAVFSSKLILCLILLTISCVLLSAGVLTLGLVLGFGTDSIPYGEIVRIGLWPYGAALPILALQLWLSLTFSNQAVSVSFGLILSIGSLFSIYLPEWVPLGWPYLAWKSLQPMFYSISGVLLGMLLLLPGALHFARKDVI
ncbi:ABC transporter permease [Paenibacillus wynnii]|uniref:Permease n=1 Tax=Paenibacillus wynnii TaxID=268407 RepID=A0A098MC80_9BACL|nr:ABC transporter permease [Paenibacillus wynnii]KGE19636.1 permease [Paenibacillus wynnii]